MAGTSRSGRRAGAELGRLTPTESPPSLAIDFMAIDFDAAAALQQVNAFEQWLAEEQAEGLDPRAADALGERAKGVRQDIKIKAGLGELAQLRELVRRKEAAALKIREAQTAQRQRRPQPPKEH